VPGLISAVRRTLEDLSAGQAPPSAAVDPKASLFRDHIVCLGCGVRVKMLRRHIRTFHDMTAEEYRRHRGLPDSYPHSRVRLREGPIGPGEGVRSGISPWLGPKTSQTSAVGMNSAASVGQCTSHRSHRFVALSRGRSLGEDA
jgi:hypothetical protein